VIVRAMPNRLATVLVLMIAACGDPLDSSTAETTAEQSTSGTGMSSPTTSGATSSSSGDETTSGATSSSSGDETTSGATTGVIEDIDMQAEDFTCILEWAKVRKFRVTNLLGHQEEALAVANDPAGGVYPVGTVIQLIPNEAMVKRGAGFSPDNSDWEFFFLDTTAQGTTITARGTTDVVNGFGGNCFDCHAKAAPQWDRICEEGHGCDPLPFTPEQIEMVQQGDPRCP
jgi:hypothetical protein